jgi:hypothetical protein
MVEAAPAWLVVILVSRQVLGRPALAEHSAVTPAKARRKPGSMDTARCSWISACAGMTGENDHYFGIDHCRPQKAEGLLTMTAVGTGGSTRAMQRNHARHDRGRRIL